MAYVNLKNKKIVGAKRGSLTWWHERGHIVYNESAKGIKNSYRMEFYFQMALTAIILSVVLSSTVLKWASLVFVLIHWYYFFYEESWCWDYAYKKMKGGSLNDGVEKESRK